MVINNIDALMYPNWHEYISLVFQDKIKDPYVILLGGYAGTGKSTVAANISHLTGVYPVITGMVRSFIQPFFDDNGILDKPTYSLNHEGYMKQVELVGKSLDSFIRWTINNEKQIQTIEGNHIHPEATSCYHAELENWCIELYLQVKDSNLHWEMLSGPTHPRVITEREFETGRQHHDRIVRSAIDRGYPVFESNRQTNQIPQILTYIDIKIGQILSRI
jgi:2-phosphoglycerate kinase